MSYTKTYNPQEIILSALGFDWEGFAEGSKIKITYASDGFMDEVGADGDVVVTRNADERADIEVTLQAASPTVELADAHYNAHRAGDTTLIRTVQVKDNAGGSIYTADAGWIVKKPDADYSGGESGTRVFKIRCGKLESVLKGMPNI